VNPPEIAVVICTHAPNRERLQATLRGLQAQDLPAPRWEALLVDNASPDFPAIAAGSDGAPPNLRRVVEPALGLTHARRRGLRETTAPFVVFVDDDNVLAPNYLSSALAHLHAHSDVGACGGRSLGRFETPPASWQERFLDLLAVRDLGPAPLFSEPPTGKDPLRYPACAPIGAGMVVRRAAIATWLGKPVAFTDRRGRDLTSGGDNDLVLALYAAGWRVAYFPDLWLEHLVPARRLEPRYLGRLNRALQRSWMQVLTAHRANPWPPLGRFGATVRVVRAWVRHRAWAGGAGWVAWQGARGHFEGRVSER
jgi:glycosyltransferase involved in cell wall biosynthesis